MSVVEHETPLKPSALELGATKHEVGHGFDDRVGSWPIAATWVQIHGVVQNSVGAATEKASWLGEGLVGAVHRGRACAFRPLTMRAPMSSPHGLYVGFPFMKSLTDAPRGRPSVPSPKRESVAFRAKGIGRVVVALSTLDCKWRLVAVVAPRYRISHGGGLWLAFPKPMISSSTSQQGRRRHGGHSAFGDVEIL